MGGPVLAGLLVESYGWRAIFPPVVLIVLASLRYSRAYDTAFRYVGFAVATVMIRLALTAPRFIDAAIGVGTMLFALVLIWIDDKLGGEFPHAADSYPEMD